MVRFAANLSFMFTEVPMRERYAAAARAGFTAVEFMFPQDIGTEEVRSGLDRAGVGLQLFNLRAGRWDQGERGIACLEGREDEFADSVREAAEYAAALNVPRCNCLAGLCRGDKNRAEDILVERVGHAADVFRERGLVLLLENINTNDMPGFLLPTTESVFRIIDRVKRDNVMLQYDVYHAQRMEGELTRRLRDNIGRIGHIQIADNPGRHQPGTGEIRFDYLFEQIRESGYGGWIGLEYIPTPDTAASLAWMRDIGGTATPGQT